MNLQQVTPRWTLPTFAKALIATLVVGSPLAIAAPAQATMYQKITHYEGVFAPDEPEELCGIAASYRVDFRGSYSIRAGKASRPVPSSSTTTTTLSRRTRTRRTVGS